MKDLYREGAISSSNEDATVTMLGELGAKLPVDLQLSKLVLLGLALGCEIDAVSSILVLFLAKRSQP